VKKYFVIIPIILIISFLFVSCTAQETATPLPQAAASSPTRAQAEPTAASETGNTPTTAVQQANPTPEPTSVDTTISRAVLKPGASAIEGSTPVQLDIVVENVQNLYGAEVHLTFDPALVQVEDADATRDGVQITAGESFPAKSCFVAVNSADNQAGKIDYAVTLLNPAPALQGAATVASFELTGVQAGTAQIEFTQVLLADNNASPLRVSSGAVTLDVRP
jgi:hypothetical protein